VLPAGASTLTGSVPLISPRLVSAGQRDGETAVPGWDQIPDGPAWPRLHWPLQGASGKRAKLSTAGG